MRQQTSRLTNAQAFDQAWRHFHEENYGLDKVPPGWIRSSDYAKLNNITPASASCILRRAKDLGMADMKKFRVRGDSNEARLVTHFKLK